MFRPTLRCSKSSNHASLPTAEEPAPPPLKGKPPAAEHRLQGVSCSVLQGGGRARGREQASALPGRLMQASPGRAEQECTSGRRKKARTAEQKRAPDRTRQDRRSKSVPRAGGRRQERQSKSALRTGRGRTGGAKACPGPTDSDCAAPLRAVPCGGPTAGRQRGSVSSSQTPHSQKWNSSRARSFGKRK